MNGMVLLVQLALGALFLMSFAAKVRSPREFLKGAEDYRLLPPKAARAAGAVLIPVEGFLAAAHLTGWLLVPASFLTLATLAVFIAAVALNLKRRRKVPCHCFDSSGGEEISARTLVRLFLMLAGELLVLALASSAPNRWVFPGLVASGPDLIHAVLLSLLLLVATAWVLKAPDLWVLLRRTGCRSCSPMSPEERARIT